MQSKQSDLTELIGSRICHDLISPLGAISNGVELLTMSGNVSGPEVSLISESIENANARIRFFRIAFGAARSDQMVAGREITAVLSDMNRGNRLTVDWQPEGDLPRREVKLAFLLLQCFETAMPWGGRVTISNVGGEWAVHGHAEQLKVDPDLWEVLSKPMEALEIDPAQVHFALVPLTVQALDTRLTLETGPSDIRVRF